MLQAPLGITALAGQVRTLRGRPLAGVMLAVVEYSYNAASRLTSLLYRQETTVLGDLIYTLTRGQ